MSTVFMIFALYNSVLLFWDINWLGQFVDFYCEHTTEVIKLNVNGKIASGSEVTKISLYDLRVMKELFIYKNYNSENNLIEFSERILFSSRLKIGLFRTGICMERRHPL